jgi:signal transduction histidine kinase
MMSVTTTMAPLRAGAVQSKDPATLVVEALERIADARELADLMKVTADAARRLTGAHGITFVLKDGDQCHYAEESAISPLWKGQRFPSATCISGWAMRYRQTVVIEDIFRDERIPHDVYRLTFVRGMAMVPIGDEATAAIGAYWAERHRATETEIAVLQTLARGAATTLHHIRAAEAMNLALKEAEARAARLAEINAARTRLLATASHDLRQPLQSVLTLAGTLHSSVVIEGRPQLTRLRDSLHLLSDLVDQLFDLSRIDCGVVKVARKDVPLASILDQIDIVHGARARAKGLGWRIAETAATVRTDPLLLSRILQNLVDNAIRYTPHGHIAIEIAETRDEVGIAVADTGDGIPADQLDEIFGEFRRLAGDDREAGLGLGLSIVRKLTGLLQHRLDVQSELGRGSVFRLTLPRADSQPETSEESTVNQGKGTVVIIDDDPILQAGLESLFESWGFTPLATSSGEEAIERLSARRIVPDLVIADYRLGGGSLGTDAIGALRALVGRPVPAILLTGDASAEDDADDCTVLHKPIAPDRLKSVVARLLG